MVDRILTRVLRIPGTRSMCARLSLGSVERRVAHGLWQRPHYAYGVFSAATLARSLGLRAISVFELGVAGGRGLLALQQIAQQVSQALDVRIMVAGFDSGAGMPAPTDYRDLPHVWRKGFYAGDMEQLRSKLDGAELLLGDVGETMDGWVERVDGAPVGFVAFDLDYYSSTRKAFRLFEAPEEKRLPRVYCYFDDIIWPERAAHNEYTGELCAIREFNEEHEMKKICPIHLLRHTRLQPAPWADQFYIMHDFRHSLYTRNITPDDEAHTQLPL